MTNAMQTRNSSRPNELVPFVNSIFDNTLRRFFDGNLWDSEGTSALGSVPVNVREADRHYEVDVIAPGCQKEDFRIQVQNNELQVSFTADENKKEGEEKAGWVRNEYVQRSFSRHFTLDETVDVQNIQATYTNGILRITLPKNEKAIPRVVSIDVK